ncbi:hypothetical protein DNU06_11410 [Putridiphycobacter roseus]|uniref:Uncharacterized protein n=1 Tax=Putridiphycobacter roseus TaxID=2219161 RepID=A0A2W1MYD1_9FLAO|nr:tetratricopeptide repeat protein [Putridiphycobacter roseus]PZE16857.1 hypothetical protein DNU06_11410 [Putridiphycobacter roseus]
MTYEILLKKAKDKVSEKDLDAALEMLNHALSIDEKGKEALYERGVLYTNLKKLDLALFDFNILISLEEDNPFYFACRAFIKTGLKDISGAIQDYEITLKLDPEDAITLNNLGLLQEQGGYKSAAEKSFEKSNEYLGYNPNRYDKDDEEKLQKNPPTGEVDASENRSGKKIIKSVFSDKNGFKEFVQFIKNGFKLKSDDED